MSKSLKLTTEHEAQSDLKRQKLSKNMTLVKEKVTHTCSARVKVFKYLISNDVRYQKLISGDLLVAKVE